MIFRPGPVFTDFLLVDEINRMPPRTQSALLECMEERQVTTDTERRPLPEVFTVFATQNPIDFEGTYPLPEAQLDRFLMKIRVGYPTVGTGAAGTGAASCRLRSCRPHRVDRPCLRDLLAAAQARAATGAHRAGALRLPARHHAAHARVAFVDAGCESARCHQPDAGSAVLCGARWPRFRYPDDVKQATLPVLRHRMMLRPEAELEGFDADRVLDRRHGSSAGASPARSGFGERVPMNQFTVQPDAARATAQPRGRLAWALTQRALYLLLAGCLFLIPAFFRARYAFAMLAWDVCVLIAVIVDGARLPAPPLMERTRMARRAFTWT